MFGLVPFDRKRNQMQNSENTFLDMDRVFENFFNDSTFPSYYSRSGLMKVDITDEGGNYVLEAELPGINKENVSIEIEDDRLTITVNQEEKEDESKDRYIRHESRRCSFCRSFGITNIDPDKISAKMENGILTLPKTEPNKPQSRKVDII